MRNPEHTPKLSRGDQLITQLNMHLAKRIEEFDSNGENTLEDLGKMMAEIMPTNPEDQALVMEEFRNNPNERFKGELLVALRELSNMHTWRELVSYPDHLPDDVSTRLTELWEKSPTLFTMKVDDRFVALSDWLEDLKENGFIDNAEMHKLRASIGPHM